MYSIKPYSYKRAKELGVIIKPSQKGVYKIDVYSSDGEYITSIGNKHYFDYPTYLQTDKKYADMRRDLYHLRHKKDNKIRGLLSLYILW